MLVCGIEYEVLPSGDLKSIDSGFPTLHLAGSAWVGDPGCQVVPSSNRPFGPEDALLYWAHKRSRIQPQKAAKLFLEARVRETHWGSGVDWARVGPLWFSRLEQYPWNRLGPIWVSDGRYWVRSPYNLHGISWDGYTSFGEALDRQFEYIREVAQLELQSTANSIFNILQHIRAQLDPTKLSEFDPSLVNYHQAYLSRWRTWARTAILTRPCLAGSP